MEEGQIKIKDIYIAKPINSEDINKYCLKFCKLENNVIKLLNSNETQSPLQELLDENNNKEYYTEKYFVQQFIKNKQFVFDKCSGIRNMESLCDMNDDDVVDVDFLNLMEKTINDLFKEKSLQKNYNV